MSHYEATLLGSRDLSQAAAFVFDQGYRDSDGADSFAAHCDMQQEAMIGRHVQDALASGVLVALKQGNRMLGLAGVRIFYAGDEATAEINILEIEDAHRNTATLRQLLSATRDALKAKVGETEWLEISERPRSHMAILLDELAREGFVRFTGKSWLKGLSYMMEVDALAESATPPARQDARRISA